MTILLTIFSCDTKLTDNDLVEYVDGRQLLTLNNSNRDGSDFDEPKISKLTPDSVLIGEEFLARIFLSDTDLTITDAFVNCDNVENPSVDTITYKVSGCKNGLS
jgi:hypothetical protein